MSTQTARVAAAGLLCLGLSGCFVSSETCDGPHAPTVGQELTDLKAAHDQGALEDEQYDQARRKLLARLDKPPGR